MMRYQARIAAFAGLPYVRIYHTLIWTPDDSVVMKEFGLSFAFAEPAREGRIGMTGGLAAGGPLGQLEAVQQRHDAATVSIAQPPNPVKQLAGWADARGEKGGFAAAVKDLAFQCPKAFTITSEKMDVQLWAPQVGPMSMKLDDRVTPAHRESLQAHPEWQEWTASNKIVSPSGAAKTHEIWIWPAPAKGPSPEAVNDLIQRPVVAMADPIYQCSTNAFEYLRPKSATPAKYRYMEDALDAMFRSLAHPFAEANDYNLWNFGDTHLFELNPWRTWEGADTTGRTFPGSCSIGAERGTTMRPECGTRAT